MNIIKTSIITSLLILAIGCNDNTSEPNDSDNFNRSEMLIHWADNIIIPAYEEYAECTDMMHTAITTFVENPNQTSLVDAKSAWSNAYLCYQKAGIYQVGPDLQNNVINLTNIYPTDVEMIDAHASGADYNLNMPSTYPAQGFPAIEYLLFNKNEQETLEFYTNNEASITHLLELSTTITNKAASIINGWNDGYRQTFIELDGSSATASVNNVTNRFVEYYERHIRANKIGIPAGVFSVDPLPQNVEARYADGMSKQLFLASLDAFQNFYNGQFTSNDTKGKGFYEYLTYLEKGSIADDINNQLNKAREVAETLDDDFEQQVIEDNVKMLELYDELQKAVILLKVDMMQALNIKVAYVDADGD